MDEPLPGARYTQHHSPARASPTASGVELEFHLGTVSHTGAGEQWRGDG